MAAMSAVANWGGQVTSRRFTSVHSQMTLAARRLAPASAPPMGANSRPLPLGRPPAGTLTGIAKRGMKGVETFALKTPDQLDDARAFVEKHGEPSPSLDPKDTP